MSSKGSFVSQVIRDSFWNKAALGFERFLVFLMQMYTGVWKGIPTTSLQVSPALSAWLSMVSVTHGQLWSENIKQKIPEINNKL